MSFYWLFLLCAVSYLLGTINFAVIFSKFRLRRDIRKQGSGNPGVMNMLRNFGFKWALIIFICDSLKSALPAIAGAVLYGFGTPEGTLALYACGLSAVVGHCFPVFFKFKGGKGAASTFGVLLAANWAAALIILVVAFIFLLLFESGSLTSFLVCTAFITWEFLTGNHGVTVTALLIGIYALVILKHRTNIARLLKGTEGRLRVFKKRAKKS